MPKMQSAYTVSQQVPQAQLQHFDLKLFNIGYSPVELTKHRQIHEEARLWPKIIAHLAIELQAMVDEQCIVL